jgi:hypothetical protein
MNGLCFRIAIGFFNTDADSDLWGKGSVFDLKGVELVAQRSLGQLQPLCR